MNLLRKIVILGGESTGKSTLCHQLAQTYKTSMVPEFARQYLEQHGSSYIESDLLAIAKGQIELEDTNEKPDDNFLFCDTDLHVLKIWSEHKYNCCHPWILNQIALRKYDAYLITSPDFPWQDDPLREHPELIMRTYFYQQYLDIALNLSIPFCILTGNEEERLGKAKMFIDTTFCK